MNIDKKYLPSLSRIFSPVVLDSIAQTGTSGYLSEVCSNSGLLDRIDSKMPLYKFFDYVYNLLFKNYRNEYIYKNAIANKILMGKHSLNTSHMLTEFRVGKCKADAVILNGTSTVYEIKSEYDSFDRLENQIKSYMEIFDHINIITSEPQSEKVLSLLTEKVGILILTNRNTIKTVRSSISNKENIKLETLFDSLRKNEYVKIVKEFYGAAPNVPNTQIFKECKKLFCEIPVGIAHDLTIKNLRRSNTKELKHFISEAPYSLIAYAMTICSDKAKMLRLESFFANSIESVLTPVMA